MVEVFPSYRDTQSLRIEFFGDEIARVVTWKNGTNTSQLQGRPIRLRIVLKDADLYAVKFS